MPQTKRPDHDAIMHRVSEHLEAVLETGHDWVGIFLQGSQNYGLDYEGSDIDTKAILLPSFEDFVLNAKPISTTHVMENNEHCDFKDIRLMFETIKKQNVNFVEILFTPWMILNPKYEDLFRPVLENREGIARYSNYAGVNCIVGMALMKQKAMEHPYPTILDKIEKYGYDPKQLHHALRMREFLTRYISGEPYADCLVAKDRDYLMYVKQGNLSLEEARVLMDETVKSMQAYKEAYMQANPPRIDRGADWILKTATVEILKRHFLAEVQDGSR